MKLESNKINDYLTATDIVDWGTPPIQQKAKEITKNQTDEISKIRCLYEWVRDKIPHSNDAGLSVVTCTASDVLSHRTGVCFSKSHLLAAFLRSLNIPAGFCYQLLQLDPPSNKELVLHGLNGIYISSIEKWIRVDARGNSETINAQFNIEKDQLAFHMDPLAGELLYETIFISPVNNVIKNLKKYTDVRDLWLDLPKIIKE